jgi:hypothetical protein
MIGFILLYNYNKPQQLTINDCLRLAPFLTGLRVSSLLRDWLGSDLRVGHFFSFRCPLVSTPQLNTQLLLRMNPWTHEWLRMNPWTHEWLRMNARINPLLQLGANRKEITNSNNSSVIICGFVRCYETCEELTTQQRWSFHCWLLNPGNVFTELLSSNGHIRHNKTINIHYTGS